MPEREWKQGDAVWVLPVRVNAESTHIRECDWIARQARVADIFTDRLDGEWVSYDRLRLRDPAKDGADMPTAESEALRG